MPDYVHVSRLREHPANIREELDDLEGLAASIRSHGILQDLTVQPHPTERGAFQVVDGHRRLAAGKLAGVTEFPVTVRAAAGAKAIEIMLITACQRSGLNPIEKAEAMGKLRRRGMSASDIARSIGLTPSTVSYYLSLLDLDESSRQLIRDGRVSAADAVGAVREHRKRARSHGKPGRPMASVSADHFAYSHPLADQARLRCQLAGHGSVKYGRDRAGKNSKVACGECWEYVIRADERGERLPADEPPPSAREERLRVVASLPMHHGSDSAPPVHVTAADAASRLGVTKRTVERYKAGLTAQGSIR